jgi:uncharacterized membrane-anchored protein YjiN (DUF445 family)
VLVREQLSAADQERRSDLRRMKGVAGGLLALAAVAYVVAEAVARHQGADVSAWVVYLRAAAVAGMVGGLADWFAVTALFRHPLGVPVPHTAIVPTRKDAIGRSLGEFVETYFLAEDVVRGRVLSARPSARAGAWLTVPGNAERVTAEAAGALRAGLSVLGDDDVQAVLEQTVVRRLRQVPTGPVLGRLLGQVVADGGHRRLVDLTLENTTRWLVTHKEAAVDAIAAQAPAWSPRFVDERVADRVYAEVVRVVTDMRDDPAHPLRASLDRFLASYAEDLQHDPRTQQRADEARDALLSHPQVRLAFADAAASVRAVVLEAVDDPDGELRVRMADSVRAFGARLVAEPELQAKVDGWLADLAAHVANGYRGELTTLITDTVERWDGRETARRIELHVGRDLQFIRINGTVVGALAGLAIEALTRVVH